MQSRRVWYSPVISNASERNLRWAGERRYVLSVDGRSTPLATANPDTLSSFLGTRNQILRARPGSAIVLKLSATSAVVLYFPRPINQEVS